MRFLTKILPLSVLVATAACAGEPDRRADDLSWLDTVNFQNTPARTAAVATPLELGFAQAPDSLPTPAPKVEEEAEPEAKAAPAPKRASSAARRSTSVRRASSSSSGTYSAPVRQPRVVEVKNTKRDAIIGGVAGAGIGAVVGGRRNRVKGAVIGGVVGAAAGAVIGSTVDKSRRIEY